MIAYIICKQLLIKKSLNGIIFYYLRIKVLMQADRLGKYRSELNCLSDIIRTDGYIRLVTRGLDATLLREVGKKNMIFFLDII